MKIYRGGEIAEDFIKKQKEFERKTVIGICFICEKIYKPKFFNQDCCDECKKNTEVF